MTPEHLDVLRGLQERAWVLLDDDDRLMRLILQNTSGTGVTTHDARAIIDALRGAVITLGEAMADRIPTAPAPAVSPPVPQADAGAAADQATAPASRTGPELLELARRVVLDYGDSCSALATCDCSMAALNRAVLAGGAE